MLGRSIAILSLLMVTGNALGQSNPTRIRIGWHGQEKPQSVKFEGGGALQESGGFYVAAPKQVSSWATYDLSIVYSGEGFPVRTVVKASQDPVMFEVRRAAYQDCEASDVRAIWNDKRSTVDERVARMMRARHLLVNDRCPQPERWKLAKRYFDTSCALAQDAGSGLDLSPEAQQLYRESEVPDKYRHEAGTCTAVAQQRAINDLVLTMERERDLGDFRRIADELIGHAENPKWATGFAALRLNADTFRRRLVRELYSRQIGARRRPQSALELNGELLDLLDRTEYRAALADEGVTRAKLCGDRALFLGGGPDTSDQCSS